MPRTLGALVAAGLVVGGMASAAPWPKELLALCEKREATMAGTPGRDVLVGTSGPDVIQGGGGRDVVRGRGGDDLLCGGRGGDRVYGGGGGDRTHGGPHADFISVIDGVGGNDRADGGPGRADGCAIDVRDRAALSCEAVVA